MDSQLAAVAQPGHDRVGNRADADLNRHAVIDIAANVARYRLLDRPNRTRLMFDQRPRRAHDMRKVLLGECAVAIHPRHLVIDLSDHGARLLHRELSEIIRDPEAVLAVLVWRAHLKENDIARNDPVHEIFRDMGKLHRNDVENACAGEVAPRSNRAIAGQFEHIGMLGLQRFRIGLSAEHARMPNLLALLDELFDQRERLAGALPPYDGVARPDYFGEIEVFEVNFADHRSLVVDFRFLRRRKSPSRGISKSSRPIGTPPRRPMRAGKARTRHGYGGRRDAPAPPSPHAVLRPAGPHRTWRAPAPGPRDNAFLRSAP